ncbi:MAG: AAA family ATPase [Desulfurivibrionaceae bacterium]|nr:AAA family ATPase [Desulfurivibrionaceae bacterium]
MKVLDESQQRAVDCVKSGLRIIALTGMPGSGKTFTIQAILKEIFAAGMDPARVYLACPTGKAAKVLEDALDIDIENAPSTIHRMLGCRGPQWEYDRNNPLPAEFVIIDEASMNDSLLMARLLSSVAEGCRFLLVGDKDQLPPVGPGCPFRDIIVADMPGVVARLETNHRQKEGSLIADACQRVISGSRPVFGAEGAFTLGGSRADDLFFCDAPEKEEIPAAVVELVRDWSTSGADYCVLAPQRTGVCGVEAMNTYLQEQLNPEAQGKNEIQSMGVTLREGDKVMHTKNNYELDVFNGFTGTIREIDPYTKAVLVDYDGQAVLYSETSDIKQLALGYCMTIHKAQGSQYQYGVVICHSSHYYMWSRQLLYTAISRFREKLYIVGNKKALKRSVSNSVDNSRQTYLGLALGDKAERRA